MTPLLVSLLLAAPVPPAARLDTLLARGAALTAAPAAAPSARAVGRPRSLICSGA